MHEVPMQLITHFFLIHLSALLGESLQLEHALPAYTKLGYRKGFGPNLFL